MTRDPLCRNPDHALQYPFPFNCPVCADLHAARVEMVERAAKYVEGWDHSGNGHEASGVRLACRKMAAEIRSLLPAPAEVIPEASRGVDGLTVMPTDAAPVPARSAAALDLDRDIDKGPRACDPRED